MGYLVTIQREKKRWVARDEDGDWRAFCSADRTDSAVEAVRDMFHHSEIGDISGDEKQATASILTD
jgi:hypothetical protein